MKKNMKKIIVLLAMTLLLVLNLSATEIVQAGEERIVESRNLDDDYVFTGEELKFTGKVDDLYFFGKKLEFTGKTKSSLTAFGGKLDINGDVSNDLILGGKRIKISKNITGTVFIGGTFIEFNDSSVVNGTIFQFGRDHELNGVINGDVYIFGGSLAINGKINGNVYTQAGKVKINEGGAVSGDLIYFTDKEITSKEKSRVNGSVKFNEWKELKKFKNWYDVNEHKLYKEEFGKHEQAFHIVFGLISLISMLVGGILLLLLPVFKKLEEHDEARKFWKLLLWGLIPFFIYPVAVIAAFILPPIGLLLFLAGFPLMVITKVIGITIFGQFLFKKFKFKKNSRILFFLFGFIAYAILYAIPGIRILSYIFFSSIGWGVILEALFNKKLD